MNAEDRKLVARMKEIRELIAGFGLVLHGYDPGITASIKAAPKLRGDGWGGESITFDGIEWGWLEPLLVELRMHRKLNGVNSERLMAWLKNPKRKPANTAFTDGPDRQTAYWMEMAMAQGVREKKGE